MADFQTNYLGEEFNEGLNGGINVTLYATAVAMGCKYSEVIRTTNTDTILNDVLYLYEPTQEVIYKLPTVADDVTIVSVVLGILTTSDAASYPLEVVNLIDSVNAQSIDGEKTFTVPPKVPAPIDDNDAANKLYVGQQAGFDRDIEIGNSTAPANVSYVAETVTVTIVSHGLTVGRNVYVSGITSNIPVDEEYINGAFAVTSVIDDDNFTYVATGALSGVIDFSSAIAKSGDLDVNGKIKQQGVDIATVENNGLIGRYEVILSEGSYSAGTYTYPNGREESDYSSIEIFTGTASVGAYEMNGKMTAEMISAPWATLNPVTSDSQTAFISRASSTSFAIGTSGARVIKLIIGYLKG